MSKSASSPGTNQDQTHDGLLLHGPMQCNLAGCRVHSGCCHRSPATQHCPRTACPDANTEPLKKACMKSTRVTSLSGSCPTGQEQQNVGCICFPARVDSATMGRNRMPWLCACLRVDGLELRIGASQQAVEPCQKVWGRKEGSNLCAGAAIVLDLMAGQARGAIQREVPQSTVHTVKGQFDCRRRVWRRRHQSPWRVKATKRGCCCGCFGAQACCQ